MPNLLTRGATRLASKLQTAAGRTVTYSRGPLDSDPITATVTDYSLDSTDNEGIVTSVIWYDWTFTSTEIAIGGSRVIPQQGDRISEIVGSETFVYEVLPNPASRRCYEDLDSNRIMTLVHTKKIA